MMKNQLEQKTMREQGGKLYDELLMPKRQKRICDISDEVELGISTWIQRTLSRGSKPFLSSFLSIITIPEVRPSTW